MEITSSCKLPFKLEFAENAFTTATLTIVPDEFEVSSEVILMLQAHVKAEEG
jgi:hypothetical protein